MRSRRQRKARTKLRVPLKLKQQRSRRKQQKQRSRRPCKRRKRQKRKKQSKKRNQNKKGKQKQTPAQRRTRRKPNNCKRSKKPVRNRKRRLRRKKQKSSCSRNRPLPNKRSRIQRRPLCVRKRWNNREKLNSKLKSKSFTPKDRNLKRCNGRQLHRSVRWNKPRTGWSAREVRSPRRPHRKHSSGRFSGKPAELSLRKRKPCSVARRSHTKSSWISKNKQMKRVAMQGISLRRRSQRSRRQKCLLWSSMRNTIVPKPRQNCSMTLHGLHQQGASVSSIRGVTCTHCLKDLKHTEGQPSGATLLQVRVARWSGHGALTLNYSCQINLQSQHINKYGSRHRLQKRCQK